MAPAGVAALGFEVTASTLPPPLLPALKSPALPPPSIALVADLDHLVAALAAEIHALVGGADIALGEFLVDRAIAVAHAAPMLGVVLPLAALEIVVDLDLVLVEVAIDVDVDVAIVPIEATIDPPIQAAPTPKAMPVAIAAPA